jgi:Holliday junction resolvase RusA-like endonuclease
MILTPLLKLELPGVPISSNNMYESNGKKRGRRLSDAAKAFKGSVEADTKNHINTHGLDFSQHVKKPLRVCYTFRQPKLYTSDWDGKVKAMQDSIFQAMGLDDRYIVHAEVFKYLDKENPRFLIEIWRIA